LNILLFNKRCVCRHCHSLRFRS